MSAVILAEHTKNCPNCQRNDLDCTCQSEITRFNTGLIKLKYRFSQKIKPNVASEDIFLIALNLLLAIPLSLVIIGFANSIVRIVNSPLSVVSLFLLLLLAKIWFYFLNMAKTLLWVIWEAIKKAFLIDYTRRTL